MDSDGMLVTFGAIEERGLLPVRPRDACVSTCSPGKVGSAGNEDRADATGGGVAVGVALAVAVAVGGLVVTLAAAEGALAIVGAGGGAGCTDAIVVAGACDDAVAVGAAIGARGDVVTQRFEEEHPEAASVSPSAQMKRW